MFTSNILYAYASPGRGFATRKPLSRGIHGGRETTPTICVATGGHPRLSSVGAALRAAVPTSATVIPLLMAAVQVPWSRTY